MESKFNYKKLSSETELISKSSKKEKSKRKFKKELREEMQKRHERVPMDKKFEGFKSLFLLKNARKLEIEP